jgi:hypothetical protein
LSYQWLKSGAPIFNSLTVSGTQTNVLNIAPAATNHIGSYSVLVTDSGGSVTSSAAWLAVVPLPALTFTNSGGGFILTAGNGAVSNAYVVQMTTNLSAPTVWAPLQTNVIGSDGKILFVETNKSAAHRFYRVEFP